MGLHICAVMQRGAGGSTGEYVAVVNDGAEPVPVMSQPPNRGSASRCTTYMIKRFV